MEVSVGVAISYKGRSYICIKEEIFNITELAKEDSTTMRSWLYAGENVRCLDSHIDEFSTGDVIHITGERIVLEAPGTGLEFIWTKHSITKKESTHGKQGSEDNTEQGAGHKVESIRRGDQGGEGDGEEGAGQAGDPSYSDGRSGEEGSVVYSRDSEGGEHAVTVDGGGGADRAGVEE